MAGIIPLVTPVPPYATDVNGYAAVADVDWTAVQAAISSAGRAFLISPTDPANFPAPACILSQYPCSGTVEDE